uniref:Small ribosomal subunit protein uS3m n=1 Tax=Chloropicon maureeniae TaxID=1461542 RepID=A0A4D6C4Z4_9CHLO|nr:ribosomal protein S3 [Chloropicon maureeniae]QBX98826.1 ribosomal protein S3 [Chloropicon maureeniae]
MSRKTNPISNRLQGNRQFDSQWWSSHFYADLFARDYMSRFYLNKIFGETSISLARIGSTGNPSHQQLLLYLTKPFTPQKRGSSKNDLESVFQPPWNPKDEWSNKEKKLRWCALLFACTQMSPTKHKTFYRKNLDQTMRTKPTSHQLQKCENTLQLALGSPYQIRAYEIPSIYWSAESLAQWIQVQLQKRVAFRSLFRHIQKESDTLIHRGMIQGIRLTLSGRLGGAELAQQESRLFGQTSLNVFAARIDFASRPAITQHGLIGIKVWISF